MFRLAIPLTMYCELESSNPSTAMFSGQDKLALRPIPSITSINGALSSEAVRYNAPDLSTLNRFVILAKSNISFCCGASPSKSAPMKYGLSSYRPVEEFLERSRPYSNTHIREYMTFVPSKYCLRTMSPVCKPCVFFESA